MHPLIWHNGTIVNGDGSQPDGQFPPDSTGYDAGGYDAGGYDAGVIPQTGWIINAGTAAPHHGTHGITTEIGTTGQSPDASASDPGFIPAVVQNIQASAATVAPAYSGGVTSSADAAIAPVYTITSAAGIDPDPVINSGSISSASEITSAVTYAPLDIIPEFGPSITNQASSVSDPTTAAEIENAISIAVAYYNTNWTSSVIQGSTVNGTVVNVVTVEIEFGYGTIGTGATVDAGAASESSEPINSYDNTGSYTALKAAVGDVLPNMPATDPTGGGTFVETEAQADLLGLNDSGISVAGSVGLQTVANGTTFDYNYLGPTSTTAPVGEIGAVGALEHEISEVFGRDSGLDGHLSGGGPPIYTIFDLYRFSNTGTPALTAGPSDYFSINGGTSALAYFNNDSTASGNGDDAGDWASFPSAHAVPNDAYDAVLQTGTSGTISSVDSIVLANIGFQTVTAVTCYREGTRILTRRGEKPIETLAIGDELITLLGGPGHVIWSGKRAIDLTRHPKPWHVWPIRIRAGAFAPGLPLRDLYVSPDHAIFADGVLVPARLLINGSTIQQVKSDHVVYYHFELEQHDVILAEGLPAESYLDAGDRDTFSGGAVTALYPEFTARRWEMASCAPLVMTGPALDAIRLRLAARAEPAIGGMSLAGA
jgi:hypothetical protein